MVSARRVVHYLSRVAVATAARRAERGETVSKCFWLGHKWKMRQGNWYTYQDRYGRWRERQREYLECARCFVGIYSPMYERQTIFDWVRYLKEQWRLLKLWVLPRKQNDDELPF